MMISCIILLCETSKKLEVMVEEDHKNLQTLQQENKSLQNKVLNLGNDLIQIRTAFGISLHQKTMEMEQENKTLQNEVSELKLQVNEIKMKQENKMINVPMKVRKNQNCDIACKAKHPMCGTSELDTCKLLICDYCGVCENCIEHNNFIIKTLQHEVTELKVNEIKTKQENKTLQNKTLRHVDQLSLQFNDIKIKQDKLEQKSKKMRNKVKELQYEGAAIIHFVCDKKNPCPENDDCPCFISPKNAAEELEAKRRIKKFLPESLKCTKILPHTIKLTLNGDSKDKLKIGINTIQKEGIEINGEKKTVSAIEEFGGIFSVGAIVTYLGTCPVETDRWIFRREIQKQLPRGMKCTKVEVGNDKVLFYINANTKERLKRGLEEMPQEQKKKFQILPKKEKIIHPLEKYAKATNDFKGFMLYIFPFGFYCRLPMLAIPLLPLAIEVTWLKAVLVNIYTIIRTSCNLDEQPFRYDFRFMYMILLSTFVYASQGYEEAFLRGVGNLGEEDGEYIIALQTSFFVWLEDHLEQLLSGSAILTQYVLDYKNAFQDYITEDGEVRKINVIMAISQIISAGLFISNGYAWFVCSFLPFIFLTRLPINPVSIGFHFGAIAAASIFFKANLEIKIENFLTIFSPGLLVINVIALIIFGGVSQMKQKHREFIFDHTERFFGNTKNNNALKILNFICIGLQLWEPHFDMKLWFTTLYLLLNTPKLLGHNMQKYLIGFLIILEGTSINISSAELFILDSIVRAEFFVGNGISLVTIGLQYVINKMINKQMKSKNEIEMKYKDGEIPNQIPDSEEDTNPEEEKSQISNSTLHNKVNQIMSLFLSATIPKPSIMLLSMIIPTFTCMEKWSPIIISGPIFVPLLYTIILIWSYGFAEDLVFDNNLNIGALCIGVVVSVNTLLLSVKKFENFFAYDFYFKKVVEPIKFYFNKNLKILLLYIIIAWMLFVLLTVNKPVN